MNKNIKLLLIILGLMILLVLIFNKSLYKTNKKKLFSFHQKKIMSVILKNNNSQLVLKKTNGIWRLKNNDPVDMEKIDRAFFTIQNLTKKDLISKSKKRQILFQVADDMGIKVLFLDPTMKTNGFIIGKLDSSYMHTYIRQIGDNHIYREPGRLSYTFSINSDYWTMRRMFYFGPKNKMTAFTIDNISIKSNPFVITAQLKKKWILKSPQATGDEEKIASLSRNIQYLGLKEFVHQTNISFTNVIGKISVSHKKITQTLSISSYITNDAYLCKIDTLPDYFTIVTNNIHRIFKNPEELIKKEKPKTNAPQSKMEK